MDAPSTATRPSSAEFAPSSTTGGSAPSSTTVESPGQTAALHPLMSPEQNVNRIMATGSVWFVGAIGAIAIALGLLLSSGWRPGQLPFGLEVIWWIGSAFLALSVGLIGWSGCPILEVSVPVADRNKTRTMQLGTLLFIVGGVVTLFAVMVGPTH